MTTNRFFPTTSLLLGVLACLCPSAGQGASLPDSKRVGLAAFARIDEVNYCFARVRRLTPERQPPSYLVLQLKIQVSYRNTGNRAVIIPLEHERTIYTALKPGVMSIFHELPGFVEIQPTLKLMKELPAKVSPDNPVDPRNDYFALVPAHGDMVLPLSEEVVLPVNHNMFLRHDPDLRGHTVYLGLELVHEEISPELETDLSDRWTRFGVPWTGNLRTNFVTIAVPQQLPQAPPCVDHQVGTPVQRPADNGK